MTAPVDPPAANARPGDLASTTVSSGGSSSPPRRSRQARRTVSSVSSTVAAPPVAAPPDDLAPAEAELSDDDTGQTTRARRRSKPAKQPKPAKQKPQKTRSVAVPRGERRFRQTIQKVDLWTVLKLSLCFYLSAMFVTLIAIVALWMVAEAAGIIGSIEKFLGDLLSAKDFKFLSGEVLRGAILITLVVVALQVVITVIAASFYNIFAELFGGLEITVKEEDQGEH
jgi:Transmembrane domain of unknown function (DUF3566)